MPVAHLRLVTDELAKKLLDNAFPAFSKGRSLDWPALEATLPDGGFPHGALVELTSNYITAGSTLLALRAVRAALLDEGAFCAWIDPYETLHAPGLVRAGIDLKRLLVVQPPLDALGRAAVKVAESGAFEIVVVEMAPVHGAVASIHGAVAPVHGAVLRQADLQSTNAPAARKRKPISPELTVRKLSLLAEKTQTTVLLLTDATQPHRLPWPTALRLEIARRPDAISVRVAKDRRGRVGDAPNWVSLETDRDFEFGNIESSSTNWHEEEV